jgi:transcriptional regulator with XRE-family HTH domain
MPKKKRGADWVRDQATLAGRITTRMEQLGLRPTDLANHCGISVTAVGWWLRGDAKNLKLDYLFKIADKLEVDPRWLATGGHNSDRYSKEALEVASQFDELRGPAREHLKLQLKFLRAAQESVNSPGALTYQTSGVRLRTHSGEIGRGDKKKFKKKT